VTTIRRIGARPEVLRWARESLKLPPGEAARRIGLKESRLAQFESGEVEPTINQLRAMANAYHRPLGALFLPEPPAEEHILTVPDYRRSQTRSRVEPRPLKAAIFRAMRQQAALREIAQELKTPEAELGLPFQVESDVNSEVLGARLREHLSIDGYSLSILSRSDVFLRELVRTCEGLNVTVIQVQSVDTQDMRGFSLGEGTCPVIALNGADWPRGKIFTLLHELAHVALRTSGLCDLPEIEDAELERRCNEAAAAALMPRETFLESSQDRPRLIGVTYARALGSSYGVSGEAALLRMVNLGLAEWDDYWRLLPEFRDAYLRYKADEKSNATPDSPLYYQLKTRDLGRRFIRTVLQAYAEDLLSSRDLTTLLEVKYDKVSKLAEKVGDGSAPA